MYEIFEELCRENKVTAYKVCKEIGEKSATISNWKAGRYTPKQDKLQKIADYFGVSIQYLISGKETTESIVKNAYDPFEKYKNDVEFMKYIKILWDLPSENRQAIYKQIRFETEEAKAKEKEIKRKEA